MLVDDTDRRLLRQLQADPALPMAELASRAAMTEATASRRLERLRTKGVLKGVEAVIDWRRLGWEVEVSLRFKRPYFTGTLHYLLYIPIELLDDAEFRAAAEAVLGCPTVASE